jgi:hypothetical protein
VTTVEMGDASTPPVPPADLPVFAFYIGGATPHVWTDDEVKALKSRWALPIYVATDTGTSAESVAGVILQWLNAHQWGRGATVVIDTESNVLGGWLTELDQAIVQGGYRLMEYESKGPVDGNPPVSGGRWVADWTGLPHIYAGSVATQYEDSEQAGRPWDASVIDTTVPLHQLNPPAVHVIPQVPVSVTLPELARGDTGPAVRRAQHLVLAWNDASLPTAGPDGIYGPETTSAVRSFQRVYGITDDAGTVTAETWARLLTG